MAKTKTTLVGVAAELQKRKGKVKEALGELPETKPNREDTGKGNGAGKKKNKQFLEDKKSLANKPKSEIERIRAELKRKRLAKEKKAKAKAVSQ